MSMNQLPIRPDAPWLAPLAGWSDLPFRILCREQGAAVCCTEMVSAKGLVYGGRNTEDLLAATPLEGERLDDGSLVTDHPVVVQIFGAEAEFMEQAVHILKHRGFQWFDVNMGCSVPKVTKTGAGAAMLRDVPNALRVAEAVIKAAGPGRMGFKLRLGWDASSEVYRELARELAALGAAWITLHPRHAVQGFAGTPRFSAIGELASELPVPVIASGDLFTAADGVRVLRETDCASVMYARGALKDPAIFAKHLELLRSGGEIPASESLSPAFEGKALAAQNACDVLDSLPVDRKGLADVIRRHAQLARRYSPHLALLKMRTFVPRYVKSMDGARALRQEIVQCSDWDSLNAILEKYFGAEL
ncbi:MAG: tRNA-dihydrouridine synthase family protein [Mailhella sp.]|nr:tRNA-dihydrouridine synthase family protein [Mailhella sp.]